jgi:hypothetical protein
MSNYAAVKPATEPKKIFPKILKLKKKKKKNRDSEKDIDTSEIVVGETTPAQQTDSKDKKNKSAKKKLLSYASKKLAAFPHS